MTGRGRRVLVPPDDPDAIVATLRRLLSDVDLRERLGAAARERVLDRFDINVVWPRFDALYRQVSRR